MKMSIFLCHLLSPIYRHIIFHIVIHNNKTTSETTNKYAKHTYVWRGAVRPISSSFTCRNFKIQTWTSNDTTFRCLIRGERAIRWCHLAAKSHEMMHKVAGLLTYSMKSSRRREWNKIWARRVSLNNFFVSLFSRLVGMCEKRRRRICMKREDTRYKTSLAMLSTKEEI